MTDTEKAEYDDVVRMLTMKLEQLAAENARLRSEKSDAHSMLKEMYNDPGVPPALRIKAAGLALPHEVPRLESVPPPLDLVASEEIIPLAQLVEQRRARQDRLQGRDIEVSPSGAVRVLPKPGSNGSDDDDSND
jgi:hypothetical protein